ncbi:hypothetical protein VE02_04802 [Pseudogymnoascus sp. 03VT05]|nr:hypothetical protein VE02_04802 [Pseudogymnoascus sp. 03VT05]
MKLSATTLAILLLPSVSLASPVATSSDAVTSDETPALFVSEKRSEGEIFERAATVCSIVNVSSTVNCRSGPGTSYPVVGHTWNGEQFVFTCYKRGTCVSDNCTWDYMPEHGCYISGYYTSSACSIEEMVRKWQHSHSSFRFETPVVPLQDPGYDLFYSFVFGCYQKSYCDPTENYVESRQFTINDKMLIMQMDHCPAGGPMFEYGMRNSNSEAVVFIYHVSDRQSFLELPSVF